VYGNHSHSQLAKNFLDEKVDRPLRRAMLFIRGFAATFSIEVAAETTARSTSTNQSRPAPALAMCYGVAGGCRYIPKIGVCLNLISPSPHLQAHLHETNAGRKDFVGEKRLEGLYTPATSKITFLNQSILSG